MNDLSALRAEFYKAAFTNSFASVRGERVVGDIDTQLVLLKREGNRHRQMFTSACKSGDYATIEICRKMSLIFRELKFNLERERLAIINSAARGAVLRHSQGFVHLTEQDEGISRVTQTLDSLGIKVRTRPSVPALSLPANPAPIIPRPAILNEEDSSDSDEYTDTETDDESPPPLQLDVEDAHLAPPCGQPVHGSPFEKEEEPFDQTIARWTAPLSRDLRQRPVPPLNMGEAEYAVEFPPLTEFKA
jgi:hypothetical protein